MCRPVSQSEWEYFGSCVDAETAQEVEYLEEMIEQAEEITIQEFFEKVSYPETAQMLGYAVRPDEGMTIEDEPYVKFFKSKYDGEDVVYVEHSCIEYIFARTGGVS